MVFLHKLYHDKRNTFAFCFFPPHPLFDIYPSPSAAVVHPSLLLSSILRHVDTTFCPSACRQTARCFSFFAASGAVSFLVDARECFSGSRRFCFNKHGQIALWGSQATWVSDTSEFPFPQTSLCWFTKLLILPVCWEKMPHCHSHRLMIGKAELHYLFNGHLNFLICKMYSHILCPVFFWVAHLSV